MSENIRAAVDKERFGPWALVTGASSGIGKEFARQIAASGINVVLVARRDALLAELGRAISQEFDVQYRALAMDLSQEGFIAGLAEATHDIESSVVTGPQHHNGRRLTHDFVHDIELPRVRCRQCAWADDWIIFTSPSRTSNTSRRSSIWDKMKSRSLSWPLRRRKSTLRLPRQALGGASCHRRTMSAVG